MNQASQLHPADGPAKRFFGWRVDVPRVVALSTAASQALYAFAPAMFDIMRGFSHPGGLVTSETAAISLPGGTQRLPEDAGPGQVEAYAARSLASWSIPIPAMTWP